MKRSVLLIAGLLTASAAAADDLAGLYAEALTRDAAYQSAKAAFQAARERIPQGRAGLLPSASLSADTFYNDQDSSAAGSRRFNSNGYSVSASQPLYRRENMIVYQQSKQQVEQAQAQLYAAGQDLVLRVAQAYFDVLLARDNVELAAAQKVAIKEQLEQAKRSFEVGTATITDTHEAQARYDLITAQEIAALNDLEVRKRALQVIIGRQPGDLARVKENVPLIPPDPNNMDDWISKADTSSPVIQAQRTAHEIAVQEVERARAGHHPTLDLVASYSDDTTASNFATGTRVSVQNAAIGVQFALPIYQGGAVESRVREAFSLQDRSREDLEVARRNVELQVRQAFLGVNSGIAQVRALEQALVSTQSQLESTKLGLEVGVRAQVDVLNAQQLLFSARRDLFAARYNYLLSHMRLRSAAGLLDDADIARVNGALVTK